MRKPATSLLLIGLLVASCHFGAKQSAAQATLAQSNSTPPSSSQPQQEEPQQSESQQNQPQQNQPPGSKPSTTLRVDVNLVNVFVTVTDEHGSPIGGLNKDNFVLKEDGREQTIKIFDRESALPISIGLAIDTSLSTRHDLPLEQAAAKRFAHDILRPIDALSVYGFSDTVHESTQGFTSDLKHIDQAIDHIRLGASTVVYDAVYVASRALDRRKGRKIIVLITDGENVLSTVDYPEALRAAQEAEALIYSIIIVPIEASAGREIGGEHALIQLSEDTGGKYYYATSTADLDAAFHKISDELRTQYLLAYYPSQHTSFSEFRRIEVKVAGVPDAAALKVRHRTGYYSMKSSR